MKISVECYVVACRVGGDGKYIALVQLCGERYNNQQIEVEISKQERKHFLPDAGVTVTLELENHD